MPHKYVLKRLLIVEDDYHNRTLFQDFFSCFGYETAMAMNGAEGVHMARTWRPDIVIMDIQMPVMDGYEAVVAMKQDPMTRFIPVIAITAYAMKGDRERILSAGFDAYVSKPVDLRELRSIVDDLFAETASEGETGDHGRRTSVAQGIPHLAEEHRIGQDGPAAD